MLYQRIMKFIHHYYSIKLEPKIERGENIWIKKLESSSLMMTRT